MDKVKNKISKALHNHDKIVKAVTTRGCKEVLTCEEGNFVYWTRLYVDGKSQLTNERYYNSLSEAINDYYIRKYVLNNLGMKLKYNEVE